MSHILIGLCGKKRAGKSLIAKHLAENHGFIELSWAHPLKQIIGKQLFFLTDDQLEGKLKEETDPRWGKTPREILQIVGTDLFREHFDKDFWVKRGVYKIAEIWARYPEDSRIVISDCRFINEVNALENIGGAIIKVVRENFKSDDSHASETSLDEYRAHFEVSAGSGQLDKLYSQIDSIISYIEKEGKDAV